jgi:hypothetical protein
MTATHDEDENMLRWTHPSSPASDTALVERLTYGQKLIAEAIEAHFGERNDDYDEDVDDTSNHDAWDAFDAMTRPALAAPADSAEPVAWGDSGPVPGHFGDEFAASPAPASKGAVVSEERVNAAVREWRRVHASGEAEDIHQAMRDALTAALAVSVPGMVEKRAPADFYKVLKRFADEDGSIREGRLTALSFALAEAASPALSNGERDG